MGFGSGVPLEFVMKIGKKDGTTQVCISMTEYTRDHMQETLKQELASKREYQQSNEFQEEHSRREVYKLSKGCSSYLS